MSSALLLRRLILAGAAVSAGCGARTGDDVSEPAELLGHEHTAGGSAGSGGGKAGSAGTSQAGKGGSVAGGSGGAAAGSGGSVAVIKTGCFPTAACVPQAWCDSKAGDLCTCDATGTQVCGQSYPWGQTTKVCLELPTPDLPCPSQQDPTLNQQLPWELGCTGIQSGPTFQYIANSVEHPACCYEVSNFGCGGRPFVVSEQGWTSGLRRRADWA